MAKIDWKVVGRSPQVVFGGGGYEIAQTHNATRSPWWSCSYSNVALGAVATLAEAMNVCETIEESPDMKAALQGLSST